MRKLVITLIILQFCSASAWTRQIEIWSYGRLFAESDLVVIAEPLSTTKTADVFDHEGNQRQDYQGMDTEFNVHSALKGESKPGHFKVLHFRYAATVQGVADGALFVHFRLKGWSFSGLTDEKVDRNGHRQAGVKEIIQWAKPEYLLFLKRRPDGRYEPVSGQYDSALACREVSAAAEETLRPDDADDE